MMICCPECHFEREIDTDKIPASASVATCPKCGNRFRFRDPLNEAPLTPVDETSPAPGNAPPAGASAAHNGSKEDEARSGTPEETNAAKVPEPPHLPTEQEGDDPLPPGAVIPKMEDDEAPERPDGAAMTEKAAEEQRKRFPFVTSRKSEPGETQGGGAFGMPRADEAAYDDVPWEQPEQYGFFGSLYQTVLRVLFRAPEFFHNLRGDANLMRPAVFYALMSFLYVFVSSLWSMSSLNSLIQSSNPEAAAMADGLMQYMSSGLLMTLLLAPFMALFELAFLAGLYYLMFRLTQPDAADIFKISRVIAYSAAPLLLAVVPVIGSPIARLWFAVSTFIGCKYALNLSWSRVTLALAPLFILEIAVLILMARVLLTGLAGV